LARQRGGETYALRHVLSASPRLRALAGETPLVDLARAAIGLPTRAVRGILFDKTPAANWKVAWHQDRTIAVRKRLDTPGFGPWSEKLGVAHVEPPVEILERMVTLRVHLDDCPAANGPLRLLPGSHLRGRLSATDISLLLEERAAEEVACPA